MNTYKDNCTVHIALYLSWITLLRNLTHEPVQNSLKCQFEYKFVSPRWSRVASRNV